MTKSVTKVAAVGVDNWKIPVFKQHLDAAGYQYEGPFPFTESTSILRVKYEWAHLLQPIVEAANAECARRKGELCVVDGKVQR